VTELRCIERRKHEHLRRCKSPVPEQTKNRREAMNSIVRRPAKSHRLLRPMTVAALGIAALLPLHAAKSQGQSPTGQGQTAMPSSPASNLSDQKLGAEAAAIDQVSDLRQTYQQQLAQAPDSDKPRITEEANGAMTKAITDHGLSVDEYNSILQAATKDPAVRDKLVQHMQPAGP
jgi:hypothetical protein